MDNSVDKLADKYKFSHAQLMTLFEQIPLNVFFKDTECRYQMASHICEMLSTGKDHTLYGKTDLDIQPDKELGKKFYNEDKEIIKTGTEMKYIQEMTFGDQTFHYEIIKKPVHDLDGSIIGVIGIISDVTELIRAQKKIEKMSSLDSMTGCYNRSYFEQHKNDYFKLPKPFAVIMADCNKLKFMNDTYGHKFGDAYIQACVLNLKKHITPDSDVIRMGGDEFLIIVPNAYEVFCDILLADIKADSADFKIKDRPLSVAYGYSIVTENTKSIDEAISLADAKMYKDKQETESK